MIHLSPDQAFALHVLTGTRQNAAIFGGAGTGKSTLLKAFTQHLEEGRVKFAVGAPTGVAALNVGGMTLHKLFKLSVLPGPQRLRYGSRRNIFTTASGLCYLPEMTFVFDEISMVRPDVLDAIDMSLRKDSQDKPFGGARVVFYGDPLQLPPIVQRDDPRLKQHLFQVYGGCPWFFVSHAWRELNATPLVLDISHRQHERMFYDALSRLRFGDTSALDYLNYRARIDTTPGNWPRGVMIGTHRRQVRRVNEQCLSMLAYDERVYTATFEGQRPDALPADERVVLKPGAQVLCVANLYADLFGNEEDKWGEPEGDLPDTSLYAANGSRGSVISVDPLKVHFESGVVLPIQNFEWIFQGYDPKKGSIVETGKMRQIPLLLGWAITAHKSQGMTLSEIEVDMRRMFDAGQSYVALSRVFSVEGLTLKHYLEPKHFRVDPAAVGFLQNFYRAAYWTRRQDGNLGT